MTKKDFTSITVILDQSGSMASLAKDTIGSYNAFVKEQKAVTGEAALTLALFDDRYDLIHDAIPLQEVPELTEVVYKPRGSTALLDAMGKTIDAMGHKFASMKEENRPEKILVMLISDGEENASSDYKHDRIKEMVSHQQDKYKWEFIFVGASNVDSFSVASSMGVSKGNTYSYIPSAAGTQTLYNNISAGMSAYRTSGVVGQSFNMVNPITAPVVSGVAPAPSPGNTVSLDDKKDIE